MERLKYVILFETMDTSIRNKSLGLSLFTVSVLAFAWLLRNEKKNNRKDKSKMSKLNNSVKPYERHIVICYGNTAVWSKSIDEDKLSFAALLGDALKKPEFSGTKVTGCIMDDEIEDNDEVRRLILYPDNIIVSGVRKDLINLFVTEMLQKNIQSFGYTKCPWNKLVLICTHGARDKRCGTIGFDVYIKLKELYRNNLHKIQILKSSHLGGHEYATTCVSYGGSDNCNYYGNINDGNIDKIVDAIDNGNVSLEIYRGNGICNSSFINW